VSGWAKTSENLKLPLRWATLLTLSGVVACNGAVEFEASEGTSTGTSPISGQFSASPVSAGEWCSPGVRFGRIAETPSAVVSISLFQGVEVPLVGDMVSVLSPVDVVEKRSAHVAITFDEPLPSGIQGELRFLHGGQAQAWTDEVNQATPHELHFRIPGDAVYGDIATELRLFREGDCGGSRLLREPPSVSEAFFSTRNVGAPRLVLVPLRFDTDGSGRLPDLEPSDVSELSAALEAIFPVSGVDITIREPLPTSAPDVATMLTELLALRDAEATDGGVAYFGFVKPAETMEAYCGAKCVAGIATSGGSDGSLSAGVGVGFRGHNTETFVHELGHIFGLKHSPCGNVSNPDTSFPHEDARLGRNGYDLRTDTFISVESEARDFMSYCDPTWISDYNYQKLIDHIALTNYAFAGGAESDSGGQQFDYVQVGPEFAGEHDSTLSVEAETDDGARAALLARRLEVGDGEGVILKIPRQGSPVRSVRRLD
jgi:hypothetical protein